MRRICPRRGVVELARKIIVVLLALACGIQSMLPCQCWRAPFACTAVCCHGTNNHADGHDHPVHQCSHSHAADSESSRHANASATSDDNGPEKPPASPTCPRCLGKSWIVLSKSFDRDESLQSTLVVVLLQHPWHIKRESRSEFARADTSAPLDARHLKQLCRMQV